VPSVPFACPRFGANARTLLSPCPQRRPFAVEVAVNDAAECSYSGSCVPDPPPSVTTLSSRVGPLLDRLLKCLRALPSFRKRQVIPDIEPASLTLQVTNVERPIPATPTDAHTQAGQETVTQFDDFIATRTHGIQPFRVQGLNTPRHNKLFQKVPKRFQKM